MRQQCNYHYILYIDIVISAVRGMGITQLFVVRKDRLFLSIISDISLKSKKILNFIFFNIMLEMFDTKFVTFFTARGLWYCTLNLVR